MQLHIPTVETPRLNLIPPSQSYFDKFAALYGDPVVMEHIGSTLDRVEAWKVMARHAGQWVLSGFGSWLVQEKDSGDVIGVIALMYPEGNIELEIGWIISPTRWGKGYATEAARAAMAFAFETVGAKRVMARVNPANPASISVAQKLGMTLDPVHSTEEWSAYFVQQTNTTG